MYLTDGPRVITNPPMQFVRCRRGFPSFGVRGRTPRPRTLDVAKVSTTIQVRFSAGDSANKTEAKHRVIAVRAGVSHTLITFTTPRPTRLVDRGMALPPARSHITGTGSRPSHCPMPPLQAMECFAHGGMEGDAKAQSGARAPRLAHIPLEN